MSNEIPHDPNPYASPRADVGPQQTLVAPNPNAVRIRKQRYTQERGLRQSTPAVVGSHALMCVILNLANFGYLGDEAAGNFSVLAFFTTASALIGGVIFRSVRYLAAWTRIPLTVIAILGLPLCPFGTAGGATILRTLYIGEHPRLLTPEYERIVRATPELNQRTSAATWIIVVLLLLLVGSIALMIQIPPEIRQSR